MYCEVSIKQLISVLDVIEVVYYYVDHAREDEPLGYGLKHKLSIEKKINSLTPADKRIEGFNEDTT